MCAVLSKALSQFANALHQHIVGYCEVWPDCGKQLLFRNKTAAILDETSQDGKGFWPQRNLVPVEK